nr:uncharacterized protein LOC114920189 [Labrus bergylta]
MGAQKNGSGSEIDMRGICHSRARISESFGEASLKLTRAANPPEARHFPWREPWQCSFFLRSQSSDAALALFVLLSSPLLSSPLFSSPLLLSSPCFSSILRLLQPPPPAFILSVSPERRGERGGRKKGGEGIEVKWRRRFPQAESSNLPPPPPPSLPPSPRLLISMRGGCSGDTAAGFGPDCRNISSVAERGIAGKDNENRREKMRRDRGGREGERQEWKKARKKTLRCCSLAAQNGAPLTLQTGDKAPCSARDTAGRETHTSQHPAETLSMTAIG